MLIKGFSVEATQEKLKKYGVIISPSKVADYQISHISEKLANEIAIEIADICTTVYVDRFLNIILKPAFIISKLTSPAEYRQNGKIVVIDYSSPNAKKPLHVGHIKSTIIGDCLCKTYKYAGYNVIPKNHIGDYNCKEYAGNNDIYSLYKQLDIGLTQADAYPESFYADMLPGIVSELLEKQIAIKSDGAVCLLKSKVPAVIKKQNGKYTYMTIDLAAIKFWAGKIKSGLMLFVVGQPQSDHFQTLFNTAKAAGWADNIELKHIAFGCVSGKNGKPLKTSNGDNPLLQDLINAAIKEAGKTCIGVEKIKVVAIGALKYSNFIQNKSMDSVFDAKKMLSMIGKTAMYLQYTYAKIISIEPAVESYIGGLENKMSLKLAKELIKFNDTINDVIKYNEPFYLANYLHNLAVCFNQLYAKHNISNNPENLYLGNLTAKTLKTGLILLGIKTVDKI